MATIAAKTTLPPMTFCAPLAAKAAGGALGEPGELGELGVGVGVWATNVAGALGTPTTLEAALGALVGA